MQQPQPAGKQDLSRQPTRTSASTGDDRQTTRRWIHRVHLDPDLHQPIIRAPGAADIGQLADVFTRGRIDVGNGKPAPGRPGPPGQIMPPVTGRNVGMPAYYIATPEQITDMDAMQEYAAYAPFRRLRRPPRLQRRHSLRRPAPVHLSPRCQRRRRTLRPGHAMITKCGPSDPALDKAQRPGVGSCFAACRTCALFKTRLHSRRVVVASQPGSAAGSRIKARGIGDSQSSLR